MSSYENAVRVNVRDNRIFHDSVRSIRERNAKSRNDRERGGFILYLEWPEEHPDSCLYVSTAGISCARSRQAMRNELTGVSRWKMI